MKNKIQFMFIICLFSQMTLAQTNTFPSSGNAGVGTTTPVDQLEVVSGTRKVGFNTPVSGVAPGGILSLSRPDDGTKIMFLGGAAAPNDDGVLYTMGGGTELRLVSGGGSGSGFGFYSNITMASAFGSVRPTPVMKIDGSGNVGIGTGASAPTARFQVVSSAGGANTATFMAPASGPNTSYIHWGNAGDWYIRSAAGTGKVVIQDSGGNVGIGTSSPQSRLDVNGDIQISNSAIPMGLITEVAGGTAPILNMSLNFREPNRNNTYRGAGIRIDSRNGFPLFQFITRSAGQTPAQEAVPFVILENGNVGIGSQNPNQKLTVNGTIYGKEVKVDLNVPGPDYVFSKTYSLRSLKDVESYIEENQHLPEVPSAVEMEKDGIKVGEMNMLLLKKVEELTLYLIKLERAHEELIKKVESLEKSKK